jgi:hypothetical protein
MAEITSPDYPGERLVVCKNPLLAEERARKRAELLAATEKELARIAARVRRARRPLRGAAAKRLNRAATVLVRSAWPSPVHGIAFSLPADLSRIREHFSGYQI